MTTSGAAASSAAPAGDFGQDVMASLDNISAPVELQNLPEGSSPAPAVADPPIDAGIPGGVQEQQDKKGPAPAPSSSRPGSKQQQPSQPDSAIGPATERPANLADVADGAARQLVITLLMHATETRHPYVIDETYLRRRNVDVAGGDPTGMSVYTLKELILRDWRAEWDNKPASPSSIRLIHYGRLLDDKACLRDCRFVAGAQAHVVHMTIKPQDIVDEEDARIAKGGRGDRDGSERSAGCRCVVM